MQININKWIEDCVNETEMNSTKSKRRWQILVSLNSTVVQKWSYY